MVYSVVMASPLTVEIHPGTCIRVASEDEAKRVALSTLPGDSVENHWLLDVNDAHARGETVYEFVAPTERTPGAKWILRAYDDHDGAPEPSWRNTATCWTN